MVKIATGQLLARGLNYRGQLGIGTVENAVSTQLVPMQAPVEQVYVGYNFTFAKLVDGTWWCAGNNENGTLV